MRTVTLSVAFAVAASFGPVERAPAEQFAGDRRTAPGATRDGVDTARIEWLRPFDGSDAEMQALMKAIEEGPRCAPPAEACPAVREQFTGGGDRLAAYLITQFEASESEGYPGAYLFLRFIAYTESATAFDYFAERLRRRDALTRKELRNTVLALGHVANPRAIDEVIPLFAEYPDPGLRADVVRAVVRTMARSGARPPRSVAFLRNLQTDPGYRDYVTRELDRLGLRRRD